MYSSTLSVSALSGLLLWGTVWGMSAPAKDASSIRTILRDGQAEILYQQGLLHQEKGNLETAIAFYTDALELNPHSAETYSARAGAWGNLEDYEAAIDDYSAAIHLDQTLAPAYGGRGLALSLNGNLDAGVEDLWTAAQLFREQERVEAYFQTLSIIEDIAP